MPGGISKFLPRVKHLATLVQISGPGTEAFIDAP